MASGKYPESHLIQNPSIVRKFQVWQEAWQRIPKAELANIPNRLRNSVGSLQMANNILRIF